MKNTTNSTCSSNDQVQNIIDTISDVPEQGRKRLTYKQLQANQETFQRMHNAYAEMFERQMEFPIFSSL
jgi:recombinational DNA repair protein RecR